MEIVAQVLSRKKKVLVCKSCYHGTGQVSLLTRAYKCDRHSRLLLAKCFIICTIWKVEVRIGSLVHFSFTSKAISRELPFLLSLRIRHCANLSQSIANNIINNNNNNDNMPATQNLVESLSTCLQMLSKSIFSENVFPLKVVLLIKYLSFISQKTCTYLIQ